MVVTKKKLNVPFEDFPEVSKDFVNEVDFRTRSALRAIDLLHIYRKKKPRSRDDFEEFKSVRYVMARFAVIELATLFDGVGKLSLVLHRSNSRHYSVQTARLKKLFPSLSKTSCATLTTQLNNLLHIHSSLVHRLLDTRHSRIAHASISSYTLRRGHLSSVRFPFARFERFVDGLRGIFLKVAFGL